MITGRRAVVYVRDPDADRPAFEPRRIVLGPRAGDVYVVLEGLEEGEQVVVNGQFKIDSELQIRGLPSMMAAADPEAVGAVVGSGSGAVAGDGLKLQTQCPVMGGAIDTDYYVDVDGLRIYVCCPGCDRTILEEPQRYIDKMKDDGVTPYRLQTHCPIMNLPIDRAHYHDHDGWRIYVCCPGCLDEVRARAEALIGEHRARGIVFERAPRKEE